MTPENFENLANTKFDFKVAKLNLLERAEQHCSFTYEGGLFKATPELICFLAAYAEYESIVLLDEYKNPILVNRAEMLSIAREAHQWAMTAYRREYENTKKVRKGDKL
jgi:hypothetical protein